MPRKRIEPEEGDSRVSTGVPGLDEILNRGLVSECVYLIRGGPGTGKSTLGLHFLTAGAINGEKVLFITMGEKEAKVRRNAKKRGFDLDGVSFLDLTPTSDVFTKDESYDIFSSADVERGPITQKVTEAVEKLKPSRVFVDSVTQFRYLSTDAFQFRKQILSLASYLTEKNTTVVFSSEASPDAPDDDLQFMCDGVINLDFINEDRTVWVAKFRGSDFLSGPQSMRLGSKGMEVFPRLTPELYFKDFVSKPMASGIPELDELLHGGLERGTVTLLTGPSGVGKTTIGIQFMKEAAGRGERSVLYSFEESSSTLLQRCEGVNIPVKDMIKNEMLSIVQVEPLYYTPDEFAGILRTEVEQHNARLVMIDAMRGYELALGGQNLVGHLHALCRYLKNMGVTTILINEVEAITGVFRATEIGISHLADNVVFLRYLEMAGELRRAIGVLKKRTSSFEKTLRLFEITRYGIKVGEPLHELRGILSGTPEIANAKMLDRD